MRPCRRRARPLGGDEPPRVTAPRPSDRPKSGRSRSHLGHRRVGPAHRGGSLGDFGTDKDYKWEDVHALAYAKPILEERYHEYVPNATFGVPPINSYEYWDAERGFYKKLPYDMPHYDEVVRDKVLSDIRSDPKWYARILWKRVKRLVDEATPVRITWWKDWITILKAPKSGKLFLVLLVASIAARARLLWKLLLFTLPTCATAIIIYSDRGIAWYGIFHLIAAAIWIMIAYASGASLWRWWRRRAR